MRDEALYSEWWDGLPADRPSRSAAIEEWLRSGLLRITRPDVSRDGSQRLPFDPFYAYAFDEENVLFLMESLRERAAARSDIEATMLRKAASRVVCSWDFFKEPSISAMRLSFRLGSIFGCTEVFDDLVMRVQTIVSSPVPVITGLADMAANLGKAGRCFVERLVAVSCESNSALHLPYLMTRLIELYSQADVNQQRDLVLDVVERYGHSLARCGDSIDAVEAVSDAFVASLRVIEGVLSPDQLKRVEAAAVYLDSDAIYSIPQLREAIAKAPHQSAFIDAAMREASDFELRLLNAVG